MYSLSFLLILTALLSNDRNAAGQELTGKSSKWHGFDRIDFQLNGKNVTVVKPEKEISGRPWVWHGEFFGHKPAPDVALLKKGFHIVYLRVPDLLGSPLAVKHWDELYGELTSKYRFAPKAALVGLSRGGLYCYNWAIANPKCVACIYGDAPVCDFKSWPGGAKFVTGFKGKGSERDWNLVLKTYGFKDTNEALDYKRNPVDCLDGLARAKVPLLHVFGDADKVVPWEENTGLIAKRYQDLGGKIQLIRKKGIGHHPHGLDDSGPIVEFLFEHSMAQFRQQDK